MPKFAASASLKGIHKAGDKVDFLVTAKRDLAAARRYLERATCMDC